MPALTFFRVDFSFYVSDTYKSLLLFIVRIIKDSEGAKKFLGGKGLDVEGCVFCSIESK